ncbi:MAG: NHLP leader peptide family RiPP precursor [Caldicoprobacterales bacterium]
MSLGEWNQVEIKSVLTNVIERSTFDADFRKLCLENPKEAIRQYSDKEIPDDFEIKMVENEATITIVLPDFKGTDGELSDLELDQVAGGKGQVKEIFNVIWEVMQVSFDLMKYTIKQF